MDTTGISPDPSREFRLVEDDATQTTPSSATAMPRRSATSGTSAAPAGAKPKNQPLTRFSLYADMTDRIRPRGSPEHRGIHLHEISRATAPAATATGRSGLHLHHQPVRHAGRAASRRARFPTTTTTRRPTAALRRPCSCRCSRPTKPSIAGATSTTTATTTSTSDRLRLLQQLVGGLGRHRRHAAVRRTCANISASSHTARPAPAPATARTSPARPARSRR